MRTAIINTSTGIVEFVLMLDTVVNPPSGFAANYLAVATTQANVGDSWNGTVIVPAPVPPPPVPSSVSRRQYYMQGVTVGWFTQAQALALIQLGTLPPSVVTFVASLPANQQFAANMYLVGSATYERNNPLLIALTTAGGISSAFMDSFFIAAALL